MEDRSRLYLSIVVEWNANDSYSYNANQNAGYSISGPITHLMNMQVQNNNFKNYTHFQRNKILHII